MPRLRPALIIIPIAAAALALAGALGNGFTNWDDPHYLILNPLTEHPLGGGLGELLLTPGLDYPIPATVLGYAAQRELWGLSPAGFHAVSLALHAACIALAALLARRLGASWFASAAAAILFALHPVVVEPVAWVVGQKDLWAAFWLLAALCVRAGPRGGRPRSAALVALLSLLAIASKPSAVCAMPLLVALDWALDRRLTSRKSAAVYAFTAAAAIASIALSLAGHEGAPVDRLSGQSLGEAAWGLGLEARHLLWPQPLLARYFPPHGPAFAAGIVLGLAVLGLAIQGAVFAARRGRRQVAFSIAGALLAYAPVSGLLPLTRGPADSYLYLPLALAVIAIARGIDAAWARTRLTGIAIAAAAVALGLGARTQTATWRDAPSLWRPVAAYHPDEPRAAMRLGDAFLSVNDPATALAVYEQLRARFPDFVTSSIAHGQALDMLGRSGEAESLFALGAARGREPVYLESYGFFLISHPDIEPSQPAAARAGLLQIADELAERGKRPPSLARAAALLDRFGERAIADRLRARMAEIEPR